MSMVGEYASAFNLQEPEIIALKRGSWIGKFWMDLEWRFFLLYMVLSIKVFY